ncbi:hypothetical protein syc0641_d [Synechococcus elongatus PCC 6301]|uniref:DUF6816 domain-containing protein n=1 Tax=Synechococcus sp. (strain ATCC 27144 / PCC 6301 / SAUG 1402/1) TaxID=269084 RepID=A0A0H3K6S3_SYNP6|nr:hypothetical protein [Synechococcus elongatus]BAD78831.1 hypothetical protein syc0641_d [Synechococcus elongatus PCC 6301]
MRVVPVGLLRSLLIGAIALGCWLTVITPAQAATLSDRAASYPAWSSSPSLKTNAPDLPYPDWMAGTWQVTSTLLDLQAPLAPEIITPGFDSNRRWLDQPPEFPVRFGTPTYAAAAKPLPDLRPQAAPVVADRAFNGLAIARAYLGEAVATVKAPDPNQQLVQLVNGDSLLMRMTGRAWEQPTDFVFIASELSRQIFRGQGRPQFNSVETTARYQLRSPNLITADQITAIYLTPQDPSYFQVGDRPIALYRYALTLTRTDDISEAA